MIYGISNKNAAIMMIFRNRSRINTSLRNMLCASGFPGNILQHKKTAKYLLYIRYSAVLYFMTTFYSILSSVCFGSSTIGS